MCAYRCASIKFARPSGCQCAQRELSRCQAVKPFVSQHAFTTITKMVLQKFIFISLSYRDHLAVQVFQEQMVYQDHQGQCLCCL